MRAILRTNEDLSLLLHGEEFDTWLVGSRMVVKFPTNDEDAAKVALELAADRLVRPVLGGLMPSITLVGAASDDFPWMYLGYEVAAGLQGQTIEGVSIEPGHRLAANIASFLDRLHAIGEDDAHGAGLGDRAVPLELPVVADPVIEAMRGIAGDRVVTFLEEPSPQPCRRRVLCHTDLKGEHLFVDEARSRLTAVIDWADAEVSDPALDLAGIVIWLGPGFARAVAARCETADPGLAERAIWLARAGSLGYWDDLLAGREDAPLPLVESQLRVAFDE